MKGNVIRLNIMHLNSVHLNSIGEVQSVSLKAGESTEDPVYPPTTYTLAANVSNGKVTATKNGTAISLPYVATEGDVIVLSVTSDEGYEFKGWLDGNKSNPRTVTMTGNVVLSASCVEIAKPTYTLSASVTNGKVSAKRNGSAVNLPYTANEGDTIVLEVTPNDGYSFEGWNDGNTDNPRTITMTADVVLSAQCVEVVVPSKYIQFEDAEVERVLMSKGVSSDGVGITKEDAAKVTSISTWFKGNTTIQSFEEFKYFTGVTQLVAQAFSGCTNLKNIGFSSNLTAFSNDVFTNSGITSVYAEGSTSTGAHSFLNCKSLVSVNLPNARNISATFNDYGSFKGCTALRQVNIPNVVAIGNLAFNSCPIEGDLRLLLLETLGKDSFNLAKIDAFVAPKLKSCGNTAFYKCPNLHTVVLRDIERIDGYRGYETFRDCTNLRYFVVLHNTPPTLNSDVFRGTPIDGGTGGIYVLDDSLEAFKTATNWQTFANVIKSISQLATDNPILYAEIQQYL